MDRGRLDLPKIIKEYAVGVELGVAAGYFSNILLGSGKFSYLYSIDAWADHHDSKEYIKCVSTLAKYGNSSIVMRMFFEEALVHFPNEYLDFIYIDAYAHTGQEDGKLFSDWYPKLKKGGIFSGHDYDSKHWPETVIAVDNFAKEINKKIIVIPPFKTRNRQDRFPSWYFKK